MNNDLSVSASRLDTALSHVALLSKAPTDQSHAWDALKIYVGGFSCLPAEKDSLIRLVYLMNVGQDGVSCSPFTSKQEKAFRSSEWTSRMAAGCLCLGGATTAVVIPLACVQAGIPFCVSGLAVKILNAVGTLASCASATVNFFSTGFCPWLESNEANKGQNHFHEAEVDYSEMSVCLVELWKEQPEQANSLASAIKIKKIRRAMEEYVSTSEAQFLLEPLKMAKRFVRTGIQPQFPALVRLAVQNVLLEKRVQYLEARVASTSAP